MTEDDTFDASLALRLGYPFDRLLAYGKIGGAWGRFNWNRSQTDLPGFGCECTTTASAQATLSGLLMGLGFEYAFLDNWTAKIEYNFISFGNPNVAISNTCTPAAACIGRAFEASETIRDTKQILKVGLNYKF